MIQGMLKGSGKRLLAFFMALLLLGLTACNKEPVEQTPSVENSDPGVTQEPTEARFWDDLLRGTLNEFQVVRSDTMKTEELKVLLSFLEVVRLKGFADIQLVTDYVKDSPVIDNEIIIGKTDREGSVYTVDSITLESGEFDIRIIENRMIFRYADLAGLMEGLEQILLKVLADDALTLKNLFAEKLFNRGIARFEFRDFKIYNQFMDEMRLPANSNTICYGVGTQGNKISVELYKGDSLLKTAETEIGPSGEWSMELEPNTQADRLAVKVDGIVIARYNDIAFVDKIIQAPSNGLKVFINGEEVDVYENEAGFHVISSLKEGESMMNVRIQRSSTIDECVVRPLSSGINPDVSGKTASFQVTSFPCKLSVEFEDFYKDDTDSVQLYLHTPDDFDPHDVEGTLLYYGPGEYWLDKTMDIPSNTTIYVAEGAILHARFTSAGADNFTIRGRGIIDTFSFAVETRMMEFERSTNITLKDYLLTGPRRWMTVLTECVNCVVDNVSIVGTRINSDGVDIVGSQNVTIENCFIRSNDDCIAVKSGGTDVKNVRVRNCVFWNDEYGNAIEIGYETRTENITDIVFEDNDLIHVVKGSCMSIHLGDRAVVSDIAYRDIRIEDANGKLIEFFIKVTQYTKDEERGQIKNITFENIQILGDVFGRITFEGFDEDHMISNVSMNNFYYNGKLLTSDRLNASLIKFTENITYNGKELS